MTTFLLNLFRALFVSLLQWLLAIGTHSLLYNHFTELTAGGKGDIGWGLYIYFGFYWLFAIAVFILNLLWNIKMQVKYKWMVLMGIILLYSLTWLDGWSYRPYKTLLVMSCAVMGFASIVLFRYKTLRNAITIPEETQAAS
ncbi:hypothetical protein HHL16_22220 [Pseudoflavitalea sp. G-6-1-2]|uniref:hypothetical protein n=1 Tax=Pseudoflavitalea sp. G-6-1-2 TaxID=2728841 RepID=UPI00146F0A60|nr:hypothetical protein [Pseudoflavitalea sp. G-6-1-2]NML23612.1 hypothetical protein [Pseudoflavitalea sp. G-6-1-2]